MTEKSNKQINVTKERKPTPESKKISSKRKKERKKGREGGRKEKSKEER